MPAKKQKPPPKVSSTLNNGFNGVMAQDISGLFPDTITIDDSLTTSITVPSTSYTWAQPYSNYSITTGTVGSSSTVNIDTDGLTMKDGCDIKIGDRSLKEFMDSVEQRLGILRPNPELEDKWENLKGLRKAYMDLEAEILEKEKMWNILKKA
jgi:hypothetical protein